MIAAQLPNGQIIKINFQHVRDTFIAVGRDARASDYTKCAIIVGPREAEEVVAQGLSFCSINDQFNKERGRQIALGRAIANFDPEIQGRIKQAYFSRSRTSGKHQPALPTAEETY